MFRVSPSRRLLVQPLAAVWAVTFFEQPVLGVDDSCDNLLFSNSAREHFSF